MKQRTYHYNYNGTITHRDDPEYRELDPAAPEPIPDGLALPSPFIPLEERQGGAGAGAGAGLDVPGIGMNVNNSFDNDFQLTAGERDELNMTNMTDAFAQAPMLNVNSVKDHNLGYVD